MTWIHVSWLARLMAGDVSCLWAPWFKAHHAGWARPPGGDRLALHKAAHTRLVREIRERWRREGYAVRQEHQAEIRVHGRHGTVLAGRPDLVALQGNDVSVIDAKTG